MPLIMAVCVIVGIFIGTFYANHFSGNRLNIINSGSNRLNNLLHIIDDQYVDKVNIDSLVDKAIPQILAELDPHSVYINAKDVQATNDDLRGSFSGVGIEFTIRQDTIHVQNVIKNGPAERAGILAGDKIVSVDGKPFVGKVVTNEEAQHRLKGPKDTKVKIGVMRYGHKVVKYFTVTRGEIPTKSISATYMLDDDTGYIRIKSFGETTYPELLIALAKLSQERFSNLVIDLRDNAGGYLNSAVQMANEFLPNNKLIVYTQGRKSPRQDYRSDGRGSYQNIPLIVLINEGSASASEIFAGAMQDNDRATVIGRRSFGKGLVQQQIGFPDGSMVRLTIARYYTPSGRCIPARPHIALSARRVLLARQHQAHRPRLSHRYRARGLRRRWHHARHLRARRHDEHHFLLQAGGHERTDSAVRLHLHRRQPHQAQQLQGDDAAQRLSGQAEHGGAFRQLRRQPRPEAAQPDDTEKPQTTQSLHQQSHHLQHA